MIDKQMIRSFREDFAEAVKDLEKKYGVVIELGHISYTSSYFDGKINVKEGESREDVNQKDFAQYCSLYGLDKEDFDRRFTHKGKEFVITGLQTSKRKYPIACHCLTDGKDYGFPAELVRECLHKDW